MDTGPHHVFSFVREITLRYCDYKLWVFQQTFRNSEIQARETGSVHWRLIWSLVRLSGGSTTSQWSQVRPVSADTISIIASYYFPLTSPPASCRHWQATNVRFPHYKGEVWLPLTQLVQITAWLTVHLSRTQVYACSANICMGLINHYTVLQTINYIPTVHSNCYVTPHNALVGISLVPRPIFL